MTEVRYTQEWDRESGGISGLEWTQVQGAIKSILDKKYDEKTGLNIHPRIEQVWWAGPEDLNCILYTVLSDKGMKDLDSYRRRLGARRTLARL